MKRIGAVAALALVAAAWAAGSVGDPVARAEDVGPGDVARGEQLYTANCSTCHGTDGQGLDGWPPIADSGAASADFQLRTGRMPFAGELGEQALRKPSPYTEQEIRDLVAFVASLGDGPDIPEVELDSDAISDGQALFASNCAPCHGATGNGGAVGAGAIAWPLDRVEPVQVAEAMLTGPGQMPVFDYPQDQLNAVVTYVEYLRTAPQPGGFDIGGIGPVPEGFVAWAVGMGLLVTIVFLVGREWDVTGRPR